MIPILEIFSQQNRWIQAAIIVIISAIIATLFSVIEKIFIKIFVKKTKTKLDDLIVEKTRGPIWLLILLIGIQIAISKLELTTQLPTELIKTTIVLTITFIVVRVFDVLIEVIGKKITAKTQSTIDDDLLPLIHGFSRVLLWVIGFLIVLSEWGIEIAPFLASLGIAGIAIGFALQDSLKNIFGGISLILDKTFKKGDIIKTESGVMGIVYDIGLRSTRIKTWDNQIVTIPNGNLSVTNIENWVQPDLSIRIVINFGVEYGSEIEKVKKLVMDIIKKNKHVSKEPAPQLLFTDMADSALTFSLRFFVSDIAVKLSTEEEVRIKIYNALNKAKIGIPFPQRTIHFATPLKVKK